MSDFLAASSLSRRKAPATFTSDTTDPPTTSGAVSSEFAPEKSSSFSRRSGKRSERNKERKRNNAKVETKALQPYNKGSSPEIMVSESRNTAFSAEQYEEV